MRTGVYVKTGAHVRRLRKRDVRNRDCTARESDGVSAPAARNNNNNNRRVMSKTK